MRTTTVLLVIAALAALQAGGPAGVTAPAASAHERGPRSDVTAIQGRLLELGYDPGPVDGMFGAATEYAVLAFQKVHGLRPTGQVAEAEVAALGSPVTPAPLRPDGGPNRIEVDLGRQLLFAYRDGGLSLISHISSGSGIPYCEAGRCGDAVTPVGDFRFTRFVPGWEQAPLGLLYNPLYITRTGIAIHGSSSVPLYPASHGCIRVPMHTAEWLPDAVRIGEPVFVVG